MISQPYACEMPCSCKGVDGHTKFIVVTGGPGAGKTAVLEFVRKIFCEHVAILPEAASILFGGGFWRLKSDSARMAAQRTIYHIQNEIQNLVLGEKKWAIGLCDRGTLDGKAYWPSAQIDFCDELKTTLEVEMAKYCAVIHLRPPTASNGYNHQNPLRTESAEEAMRIDERIGNIWRKHPNYYCIDSSESFIEKLHEATVLIKTFLPECCRASAGSKAL